MLRRGSSDDSVDLLRLGNIVDLRQRNEPGASKISCHKNGMGHAPGTKF